MSRPQNTWPLREGTSSRALGGVAPETCTKDDEGYRERVPYTADYILYGTR